MSTPPRRMQNERMDEVPNRQQDKLVISNARKQKDCRYCQKDHPLRKCSRFHRLSATNRLKTGRRFGYCTNCLAHSHQLKNCRSREKCKVCFSKHHTLLHDRSNRKNKNGRKVNHKRRNLQNMSAQNGVNVPTVNGSTSRSATIIINVNPTA